jgi:AmmeMemoRadiSam system protein B
LKLRRAQVAGSFYSGTKAALTSEVESCFTHRLGPGKIPKLAQIGERKLVALVCPHAGYMYSGPTAAKSYFELASDGRPNTIVIIGPNHTGEGSGVSMMPEGVWETPLGQVEVDEETATEISKGSDIIDLDDRAHLHEHSIEVQLPFLQYVLQTRFKFVPICMMMQDLETSAEVGKAVGQALKGKDAIVIASSDMTHYESADSAKRKDRLAIDAILALDDAKLQETVESHRISMCGHGAVASAIAASKILNAKTARLLGYSTSGDITEDNSAVVGYLAASIEK